MAQPPLLQLTDIALGFGGDPLFRDLSLVIQQGDRLALVGRNGSGKSTLLKVMAGLVEPDAGARTVPSGTSVGYMEQEPDMAGHAALGDFALRDLGPADLWRVEAAAEGLKLDLATETAKASGGERRRAALAKLLAEAPDLMLLDEPTNHLDIEAIAWLETRLSETRQAFVTISHDRAFLRALTRATLWIDRGEVRRRDGSFDGFEAWRDKTWDDEDEARHKLNRKIKAEARWAVEGISARRKRNQGRVRALQALRVERAAQIMREGTAAMAFGEGPKSGRRMIEAKGISKAYGDKNICRNFDLRVMRGDRVAFVGPNGVGKTTLIELLFGQRDPDSGTVTLGSNIELAVFDQRRAQLDAQATLWESLTQDKSSRVAGRSDQVMVRGTPRHVVGYLKDFLFDETQARAPVAALSGGEKARLLLARIMAKPSNLLVLDEPTNDLDIETLDLLQEIVSDYDGTVLIVSHDRDFIDRVATTTVALEGAGRITVHAGGWSDYAPKRKLAEAPAAAQTRKPEQAPPADAQKKPSGLTFTEKHRLDALPAEIARLEAEIVKLGELLSDTQLFTREPVKFAKASEALTERQTKLAAAEEEWLMLAEKAEAS
ncbi:MAG: ATP-binding cassette domain-containing protein [Silicimonas sp.]|jgi:ATP-binding cassette subfamily F protein uup|nr:ATP-binding cassette domain-containing protein [Silicimonas sp.]